jgi:phytoene synthase
MNDHELAALVRRADPDRFLGAMFAPAPQRRDLLTLYAFNHELARAREVASTPPLALIRLHWWREVAEGAVRDHPVATLLRDALDRGAFTAENLIALIDAREAEAEPIPDLAAFLTYARGTSGHLCRIAGRTLGISDHVQLKPLEDIGTGFAIARILTTAPIMQKTGRDLLPHDGTDPQELVTLATALLKPRVSRAARPISALSVLARRDLARLSHGQSLNKRGIGDRLAVLLYFAKL